MLLRAPSLEAMLVSIIIIFLTAESSISAASNDSGSSSSYIAINFLTFWLIEPGSIILASG